MNYTIYSPAKIRKENRRDLEDVGATGLMALAIIVYGVFFAIL